MSFVITMDVREGIVMARDSRLNLTTQQQGESQLIQMAVVFSDSNYKTFLAPNNVEISIFVVADIQGFTIAGYIESFISENLSDGNVEVNSVPLKLLEYFRQFSPLPLVGFTVAGYKLQNRQKHQLVWYFDTQSKEVRQVNIPGQQGAQWDGEADILARLINPVAELDPSGKIKQVLPYLLIPWQFFNLQDDIDFSVFAVWSAIDAIRFQLRPKSVGGLIDVLVIRPDKAFWVQRKELYT